MNTTFEYKVNSINSKLPSCFNLRITLDGNDSSLPRDVQNEISDELWPNVDLLNNDTIAFDAEDKYEKDDYPAIKKFLKEHNIKECYITFGW